MINYFRLLIVGSVLFILLGAFNEQSEDSIVHIRPAWVIENMDFQPGIIPALIQIPESYSFESNSTGPNHHYKITFKGFEDQFSRKTESRLAIAKSEFSNMTPVYLCKTGQFLHSYQKDPEPSVL